MAYSDLDVDIVYVGDGLTTTFPINFARTNDDYVAAELYDVTDPANPVQLPLNRPADWTVVGNDVVLTTAPSSDQKLMIYRSGEPTHETNYTEYEFPYQIMNTDLDKVYQLAQENKRELELALKNPRFNVLSGDGDVVTLAQVQAAANSATQIIQNTTDIATNTGNIATNSAQIATNTGDIATNSGSITANSAQIATNVTDIADHESRITQNESDISAIQTAIGGLTPPTIVSITAATTHNAANQEIVIIDTNDTVDVQLPAPALGEQVKVKVSEKVANKTITSASGIDGFGTTYTVSSEYESLSLVSDGTKWYII